MAGTAAARYQQQQQQQQQSQQQQLMQKLHHGSSAGTGPGAGPPPHHPFYSGPPQSPAGFPGYGPGSHGGPGPPPGAGFGGPGGPGSHQNQGLHHHAGGMTPGAGAGPGLHGPPGSVGPQNPGTSPHPYGNQGHLVHPAQAHQQHQQAQHAANHQLNGHQGSHPGHSMGGPTGQHGHLNGTTQSGQQPNQPVPTFAGSDSSFARQQMQFATMSRGSSSAHHHARAAHLQQRGMTTSGSVPIGDPTRHPSMSIGTRGKDGKDKDGNSTGADGAHKRGDSEAIAALRAVSVNNIRKLAAPGADTNAPPVAKELNTALVIEAEREKIGQPWSTLDMGGMHLRNLSADLFKYSFLTTLYVPHNNLTSLPPALSTLSHLILLDASSNKLSTIPGELGMLTNLRELLLFDNQLSSLPPELGTLHQLDMLGIEGNPLPDNIRSLMEKEGTSGLIAYLRDSCPVPLPPPDREWITVETDIFPPASENSGPEPEPFSVLSFNVLCEKYATPQMYGYTPSWALAWDYRKELILQEIVGYGADLLCLQEVEGAQYEEFFLHHLSEQGYSGVYFPKSRARTMSSEEKRHVDGCAIFYKEGTFSLIEQQVIEFNQVAMRRPDFKKTEDMFNRVMRRDDVAVLALLEHKLSGARLIVANAHIYWDPEYRDVKLVQVAMMMDELSKTADHFARLPPKLNLGKGFDKAPSYSEGRHIPTVICGDFNSVAESGVYQFLSSGSAPGNHEDFMDHIYGTYTSEGVSHKFPLKSAYSHLDASPDRPTGGLNLTNYVPGFRGVIDHIWYNSAALSVTGLLGEIDQSYISKVVGFPNAHFPSDHISILAELKFKSQNQDSSNTSTRQFRPVHHPPQR